MRTTPVAAAAPTGWKRESLAPGAVLLVVAALAWGYTLQAGSVDAMPMGSGGPHAGAAPTLFRPAGLVPFLFGWAVMMVAMMLPAALPLVLLYRATARRRLGPRRAAAGMGALLAGYLAVWTVAGLPVHAYNRLGAGGGTVMAVLPGLLLITGGLYQFTALKSSCHARCSSPLFTLTRYGRPGVPSAARLGVLHGVDCLGCCVGLMLALVALGMMNAAWMLSAAVVVFVEKTLPGGHRVARPLGVAMVAGGVLVLGTSLLGGRSMM